MLKLPAAVLVCALVVAACGSDDEEPVAEDDATGDADLPPEIAEAKAKADELGLRFVTSREELEEKAKQEDGLNIIWSLAPDPFLDEAIKPFIEKYPHVEGNVTINTLDGPEGRQRFLLEAEAGAVDDYNVGWLATEAYADTAEYCDWDLLGMAEAGILDIPPELIDPEYRTIVAAGNSAAVFVYNIEAFERSNTPLPETWDDLLDPELYGPDSPIAMVGDARVATTSAMVPAWGLDRIAQWYKDFAEKIQPAWSARFGPMIQQIQTGEFHAMPFVNLHNTYEAMEGRPPVDEVEFPEIIGDRLGIKFLEPVPVRLTDTHCALSSDISSRPYTSLLFLEWLVSPEGQLAYENPDGAPFQGSLSTDYENGLADLLEGAELSRISFEDLKVQDQWIEEILEAGGFPEANVG